MARINLRCTCGFFFGVPDTQLEGVKCPSCLRRVAIDQPDLSIPSAPRKDDVKRAAPSTITINRNVIALIGGGIFVVAVGVIYFISSGGEGRKVDPHRLDMGRAGLSESELRTKRVSPGGSSSEPGGYTPPVTQAKSESFVTQAPVAPSAPSEVTPGSAAQPPVTPAPAAAVVPIIPERLALAREAMALHPWYRELVLTGPERLRVESVLSSGRGTPEDVTFLETLAASKKLKAAKDEQVQVRESLARLQKDAFDSLPVDRVVMTDNRIMNGRIVEEGPDTVRFERKLGKGVGGIMNLKRAEIRELQKGKGIGGEFRSKWDLASKGTLSDQLAVMAWCRENSLVGQAQMIAFLVLGTDPGNAPARAEAGLPANPVQAAIEIAAQGGGIAYQGRTWAPKELKERLIKDGFALINGEWFARKERMISVGSLFKYERQEDKPVLITSSTAPINHETEMVYKTVQNVQTNQFTEAQEVKFLRRFYAPTLSVTTQSSKGGVNLYKEVETRIDKPEPAAGKVLVGEVFITVPVGAPIIEASVITTAETKQGGSITVFQIVNGERTRLYACKSKEDESHPLADSIRGQTQAELVAVITTQAAYTARTEKRDLCGLKMDQKGRFVIQKEIDVVHERQIPDYRAILFPSHSNTYEVFRLKAVLGEPAVALNRLFSDAGVSDALKQ